MPDKLRDLILLVALRVEDTREAELVARRQAAALA